MIVRRYNEIVVLIQVYFGDRRYTIQRHRSIKTRLSRLQTIQRYPSINIWTISGTVRRYNKIVASIQDQPGERRYNDIGA